MALVKNKLSPVDQFLNTSISVLYVRISKLITDMAILSKMEQDLTYQIRIREKGCFQGIETGSIFKMSRNMGK